MAVRGKIIKSLSGFYEVHTGPGCYRCRARGVFRALGIKPLVGDDVEIDIVDEHSDPREGSIVSILPRRNVLIRPSVANVDQAVLVFAVSHPLPSFNMLDRFLITMGQTDLPAILAFNKSDIAAAGEMEELRNIYEQCGCRVLFMSTRRNGGIAELQQLLSGRTTVLAGPSGAGKSTLINLLCPQAHMETGELSRRIERGKNTTRHIELFAVDKDTYVMDTPGFTSLYLENMKAEELKEHYPEFDDYAGSCRFSGCMHMEEPGCAVKKAVAEGRIPKIRYDNYRVLYAELKDRKPVYPH